MRYLLFVIVLMLSFNVSADPKKDEKYGVIKQKVEVLSGQCFNETLDKTLYNLFNKNKIEENPKKYHTCLKEIVVEEIQAHNSSQDIEKMMKALKKIDEGIAEFYDVLYKQTDKGWYSQLTREMSIGSHYKQLLVDVLYFQDIYIKEEK